MMNGILEVQLIDARALNDTDTFGKMDPYVLMHYKDQKLKSKVAKGQGKNPVWNDKFTFWVKYPEEDEDYSLILQIMDKDTFTTDDFVGEVRIDLKDLVVLGVEKETAELQPRHYNVIDAKKAHGGEVQAAFTFTLKGKHLEENTEHEL